MRRGVWFLAGALVLACGGIATQGGYDEGGMNGGAHGGQGTSVAGRSRGGTMTAGGRMAVPASGGATTATAGTTSASGGATTASAGTGASMAGSFPVEMPMGPAACFKDTDCPGAACGGEVCNWNKTHPVPVGDRVFVCNPAGTSPQGGDGWCVTDADCKCRGLGAVCVAPYCSFTRPSEAP